jgi:hypothetical protein
MDVFLLIAAPKRFQVVPISGWSSRLIQAEALHTKAQPTEAKTKLGMRKFLYQKGIKGSTPDSLGRKLCGVYPCPDCTWQHGQRLGLYAAGGWLSG